MRRLLLASLTVSALALGIFAAPAAAAQPAKAPTIVDVALAENAATGEFSILLAALDAADPSIVAALGGNGQYTVFAPTDLAFASLLSELNVSAADLLANKALLNRVLTYHVARGERLAADVLDSSRIRTLNGGFVFQSGGVLTDANGRTANFVATDIPASNGVIHVIDRVILPR
jgi:transforming growth factor-beta-induced protein